MVSIYNESPTFHDLSCHLEILGSKIEVSQQTDKICRKGCISIEISSDLPQTQSSVLLWIGDDFIEALSRELELALAQIHNTFVELVDDSSRQFLVARVW